MHLLLINDDGLAAPGMEALAREALDRGHTVRICAPDRERSAASHGLTLNFALHPQKTSLCGVEAYRLDGTPADCARMGLFLYKGEKFDLVISGINFGRNLGGACIYSGTVNAAMEAAMIGFPAMAASMPQDGDFALAAKYALRFAAWAVHHPLPQGVVYNLNVPSVPERDVKGLKVTGLAPTWQGTADYTLAPDGGYLVGKVNDADFEKDGLDDSLNREGWLTVTPVTWNFAWPGEIDMPEGVL